MSEVLRVRIEGTGVSWKPCGGNDLTSYRSSKVSICAQCEYLCQYIRRLAG